MQEEHIIEADWTWTGDAFERDIQVVIEPDGMIHHVGAFDLKPTHRLTHHALLPGMVNAHSHAFQRGLRGSGETFPDGAGSFWSWREAMYDLVRKLGADDFRSSCTAAFREMLRAGITTVGEFHYLHHESPEDEDYRLDELVLDAASTAGIRIVLLNAFYSTGGVGRPLDGAQRRFATRSADTFWAQMDRLADRLDPQTQSLGVVAHSIRAAGVDEITGLHAEARRREVPFHMHVEEQRKEIEECEAAYGKPPMAVLLDRLEIDERVTAVHCTHTRREDMRRFVDAGGSVCLCPLTEANLGDGIADVPTIRAAGGHVCIGTDSNLRICMTEEMRWLEYVQRLRGERRGVCVDATGSASRALWESATIGGARSLGVHAGRIGPGDLADFITIDLSCPSLAGWRPETLLDAFIFGTGNDAIAGACVGGRWHHLPGAPVASPH